MKKDDLDLNRLQVACGWTICAERNSTSATNLEKVAGAKSFKSLFTTKPQSTLMPIQLPQQAAGGTPLAPQPQDPPTLADVFLALTATRKQLIRLDTDASGRY